ncbi:unnamed protein product [Chrysoparadoxa australica]
MLLSAGSQRLYQRVENDQASEQRGGNEIETKDWEHLLHVGSFPLMKHGSAGNQELERKKERTIEYIRGKLRYQDEYLRHKDEDSRLYKRAAGAAVRRGFMQAQTQAAEARKQYGETLRKRLQVTCPETLHPQHILARQEAKKARIEGKGKDEKKAREHVRTLRHQAQIRKALREKVLAQSTKAPHAARAEAAGATKLLALAQQGQGVADADGKGSIDATQVESIWKDLQTLSSPTMQMDRTALLDTAGPTLQRGLKGAPRGNSRQKLGAGFTVRKRCSSMPRVKLDSPQGLQQEHPEEHHATAPLRESSPHQQDTTHQSAPDLAVTGQLKHLVRTLPRWIHNFDDGSTGGASEFTAQEVQGHWAHEMPEPEPQHVSSRVCELVAQEGIEMDPSVGGRSPVIPG